MMENENLSTEACVEEEEPPKLVNGNDVEKLKDLSISHPTNEESAEVSAAPQKDEGE